ncbi:hypothetical protein GF359_03320 [candidate division WOR-3 bacterium]|uniref:4-vinyl reductase 4VR domain-containing protein n=1 Tax=candidate division WOR-3 bacterium TaxID=2052148 RepID=A0A9D5K9U1_UNCW3|nr:hypothetical protein [candidate division WOR-3 bacterium]MBD3364225.1 hypothetical protein [candidate division WOR-3 bacterium]
MSKPPGPRHVRGVFLKFVREWMAENYGEDFYKNFKTSLTDDQAELLDNVERAGWYPADQVFAILEKNIELVGEENIEKMVRANIQKSVSGFLKGLASFASPANLAKRAPAFWKRMYSSGRLQTDKISPKEINVTVYDWKGIRFGCRIIEIWLEEMISLTGVKKYSIEETHCVFEGDEFCRWKVKILQ